jgi:SIR2-like domain
MAYYFSSDKIIVLLGAGASVDATIPHSNRMIDLIQEKLDVEWTEYKSTYYYIKSLIYSSQASSGGSINFNIETLVAVLNELLKVKEKNHGIYAFVGSWEKDLLHSVGEGFSKVEGLKEHILKILKDEWIPLKRKTDSAYYKKLISFAEELEQPLRIFSLNYDLCVEENCNSDGQRAERGFTEERYWDYTRFQPQEDGVTPPTVYLYKLHGSIDWTREANGRLTYTDALSAIPINKLEIIFGLEHKMQSYDPYLFSLYEFREYCLGADVILVAGYGFADDHVNRIITQALTTKESKKLVINTLLGTWSEPQYKNHIRKVLRLDEGMIRVEDKNIIVENMTAKEFIGAKLDKGYFDALLYDTTGADSDLLE